MSDALRALTGTAAGHDLALVLALLAAPFALLIVPWPEPWMWPIFAGAFVIHSGYKYLQAMTYARGTYSVGHLGFYLFSAPHLGATGLKLAVGC